MIDDDYNWANRIRNLEALNATLQAELGLFQTACGTLYRELQELRERWEGVSKGVDAQASKDYKSE